MINLEINRILVPVDFSETSRKAINHAAPLAKLNNGELFLLYVRRKKNAFDFGFTTADLRDMVSESANYKRLMEETAREIRAKYSVPVKVLVAIGGRIPEIIKVAEKKKIGLIIMGTRGSDSDSNLFSGSNSYRVVSRSEIPVMTVRNTNKKPGYGTILLPIDSSEHSRQKVNLSLQMAKMYGSNIHLLGLLNKNEEHYAGKLKTIMRQVEKRVKADGIKVTSETIKTDEPVKKTLLSAKRNKADVIITMTDEHSGSSPFKSRYFDRELVDVSQVPVLSVPPEIHEENIEPGSLGGVW